MYILSIETTGKYGSAALIDGDGRISSKSSHEEEYFEGDSQERNRDI